MKLLLFFPLFLFAFNIDFSACFNKYKNIYFLIPVSKNKSVTFSKPSKYIYFDPFTKMYVVKHQNKNPIKFYDNAKLGWWMAGINFESVYGGTFAKDMLFLTPAKLSVDVPKNSVISDIFCKAYGIGNKGFIKGEFVKHFAKYGYWGDIGIGVDRWMRVEWVDPFYVKGVKPGDKLIKINLKPANVKTFSKYVLLGKKGDIVVIKTNHTTVALKIRKKIYNFTPLMHFGIVVNKNLKVVKLPEFILKKTYIKPPAKLIAVNGIKITSFDELKRVLSFNKNVTITLQKDGIKITIPLRR